MDEAPALPATEIFLSFDIETTGPAPGHGSMISIAWCPVFAHYADGTVELRHDLNLDLNISEYASRDPDTMESFWSQHPEAWLRSTREQRGLRDAMRYVLDRLRQDYGDELTYRFAAKPIGFDLSWLRACMMSTFPEEWTALGSVTFSGFDIGSHLAGLMGTPYTRSTSDLCVPAEWRTHNPMRHVAINDAIEQAELLRHALLHAMRI
jgi:hypothetical protein